MLDSIIEDAKKELLEELEGEDIHASRADDLVNELADSWVPIYTGNLIEAASDSGQWWESVWLTDSGMGGTDTPLDMVRGNIYALLCEELNSVLWAERERNKQEEE